MEVQEQEYLEGVQSTLRVDATGELRYLFSSLRGCVASSIFFNEFNAAGHLSLLTQQNSGF